MYRFPSTSRVTSFSQQTYLEDKVPEEVVRGEALVRVVLEQVEYLRRGFKQIR